MTISDAGVAIASEPDTVAVLRYLHRLAGDNVTDCVANGLDDLERHWRAIRGWLRALDRATVEAAPEWQAVYAECMTVSGYTAAMIDAEDEETSLAAADADTRARAEAHRFMEAHRVIERTRTDT